MREAISTSATPTATPDRKMTSLALFYKWEKEKANEVYLKQPQEGKWTDYTWKEVGDQARRIAAALQDMGIPAGSNIGLISKNCAHWIIWDVAMKIGGFVSVPFYPNLTSDQLRQVLEHSECKALFVGKLDDLDAVYNGVPEGIRRIAFPISTATGMDQWADLIQQYAPLQGDPHPELDAHETIVYTSGTTGIPKGVVKTYAAGAYASKASVQITKMDQMEGRYFSYLPLNHDAERATVAGGSLLNGGTIYFAESLDTFADNLREAKPTVFLAVPRIWAKFQMGVLEKIPQKKLDLFLKIPILSGLIKKKIKQGLGLENVIWAISGAAPISASTLNWYKKIGITITEGYGMTENSAICTINPREDVRIGTVGKPYPGCNLKIDPKTQEVLMEASWLMKGYYKNEELTNKTIIDGWLHTGDMGELVDGFLKITGRVKDMFKTSKGEYIIPVPMERMFASNTLIEQVCIVGYGLPQPFALVNLSDVARHMDKAEVEQSLEETVEQVNASVADYEQVNKLVITQDLWTVENGLMTPTLKVRRNVMDARYKVRMESWYNEGDNPVIWE
ncbi:MAG: AMP-binding protein [Bacteroidota bacterium]